MAFTGEKSARCSVLLITFFVIIYVFITKCFHIYCDSINKNGKCLQSSVKVFLPTYHSKIIVV